MENTENGGQGPQASTVKPIWEVLGSQSDPVTIVPPTTETAQTTDVIDPPPIVEEVKTDTTTAEPAKEETTVPETDVKPEGDKTVVPETDESVVEPILELKIEDIKDAPVTFEDGTFQALGEDFGLVVPEESFEAFKKVHDETYILKSEAQKLAIASKEELFKTLDPKLATAFELIDAGVPPELALNPTKEHDEWLAKDSSEIVRAKLMNQYKGDEELVDAKMEELSLDPQKLEVQAKLIKADVSAEKEQILQEQAQIYQRLTEQKKQAAVQQKMKEDAQFEKALAEEQAFLGVTLSKEYKQGLLANYKKGKYDGMLSAQAKVRSIILQESGDVFTKTAISKAKQQAKAEIVGKLSDVPPKVAQGGGRQQVVPVDNQTTDKHPFAYMPSVNP